MILCSGQCSLLHSTQQYDAFEQVKHLIFDGFIHSLLSHIESKLTKLIKNKHN